MSVFDDLRRTLMFDVHNELTEVYDRLEALLARRDSQTPEVSLDPVIWESIKTAKTVVFDARILTDDRYAR